MYNRIENQSLLESVILIKNFIYFWVVKRQHICQDMSFMHGPTLVLYVIDMWERNIFHLYTLCIFTIVNACGKPFKVFYLFFEINQTHAKIQILACKM